MRFTFRCFIRGLKRRQFFRERCAATIILGCLIALPVYAESSRNVVVLYGLNRLMPTVLVFDQALHSAITEGTDSPVDIHTEFFDFSRFPEEADGRLFADYLHTKYEKINIDIIVLGGTVTASHLLGFRNWIFPKIPVVFGSLHIDVLRQLTLPPDIVGTAWDADPTPTLTLALSLHPETRRLVLITGTSHWDKLWEMRLRKAVRPFRDRVDIEFWAGLPMMEISRRLQVLPNDTLVFTPSLFRDGAGKVFIPEKAIERMATVATVPIYSIFDTLLGRGIVGGYMPSMEALGRDTGNIVARILNGEPPETLKLPDVAANHYIFDGRQLRRWDIDKAALPAGSQIRFLEPTFWQAYQGRILLTIGLLLLQTVLIGGLLFERRSRRRVTAALRESEKRMKLTAQAAGLGLWIWNIDDNTIWASSEARNICGFKSAKPVNFDFFMKALHQADRELVQKAVRKVLAGNQHLNLDYRIVHPNGSVRWIAARGQMELTKNGHPNRLLGILIDITENKETEMQARQHRNELLHLTRVNMLGDLSASLAHELSQPLTAILSNAQAARRQLALNPIDLKELQEILGDIIDEDQRAAEIIRRLRILFHRGEVEWQTIHVNQLIRDTMKLVYSDLVIHGVIPIIDLAADLPVMRMDAVQLQQVLLNLITNAVDAMMDNPFGKRKLAIRAEAIDQGGVRVSVMDSGRGIDTGHMAKIFEPFFTTKSHGMGLGLSLSQSILSTYGSRLTVSNNPDGGAIFSFVLPGENHRSAK